MKWNRLLFIYWTNKKSQLSWNTHCGHKEIYGNMKWWLVFSKESHRIMSHPQLSSRCLSPPSGFGVCCFSPCNWAGLSSWMDWLLRQRCYKTSEAGSQEVICDSLVLTLLLSPSFSVSLLICFYSSHSGLAFETWPSYWAETQTTWRGYI